MTGLDFWLYDIRQFICVIEYFSWRNDVTKLNVLSVCFASGTKHKVADDTLHGMFISQSYFAG